MRGVPRSAADPAPRRSPAGSGAGGEIERWQVDPRQRAPRAEEAPGAASQCFGNVGVVTLCMVQVAKGCFATTVLLYLRGGSVGPVVSAGMEAMFLDTG